MWAIKFPVKCRCESWIFTTKLGALQSIGTCLKVALYNCYVRVKVLVATIVELCAHCANNIGVQYLSHLRSIQKLPMTLATLYKIMQFYIFLYQVPFQ